MKEQVKFVMSVSVNVYNVRKQKNLSLRTHVGTLELDGPEKGAKLVEFNITRSGVVYYLRRLGSEHEVEIDMTPILDCAAEHLVLAAAKIDAHSEHRS